VERCKAGEWICESCTFNNQDTDIECQMCEHAPWKEKLPGRLMPVSQSEANGGRLAIMRYTDARTHSRSSQHGDQTGPTWTCSACTVLNQSTDSKCTVCDTSRTEARRYPDNPQMVPAHPPPYTRTQSIGHSRSCGDVTIFATVDESTQTEGLDGGNPAQKVIGQIGRICRLVRNRGSPRCSRDASPSTHTPSGSVTSEDGARACWCCSQCQYKNGVDRTECERCGFEDDVPVAVFPPSD